NSRVIVVPDGPLNRLNLETLVVPSPKPHYWIEDVEASVAPSLALAATETEGDMRTPSLLLMGAPDYAGTSYQPLAGAAREVEQIRARFAGRSAAVLTGSQATPEAYRRAEPAGYSLIHFAAHAEANPVKPLESAVVLSHENGVYKLYARDVV